MAIEFVMDAINIKFTNNKNNPVRPWFKRMIDGLQNGSPDNWDTIDLSIKMHPDLWNCISCLYAFGHYYSSGDGNVYFSSYTDATRIAHEEYLSRCALPIGGRWYSVVLDNTCSSSDIYFVALGILGHMQNIYCSII